MSTKVSYARGLHSSTRSANLKALRSVLPILAGYAEFWEQLSSLVAHTAGLNSLDNNWTLTGETEKSDYQEFSDDDVEVRISDSSGFFDHLGVGKARVGTNLQNK